MILCYTVSLSAALTDYQIILPQELEAISQLLEGEGFSIKHTEFDRDWDLSTKFKLPWVMNLLSKGIGASDQIAYLREMMAEGGQTKILSSMLRIAWQKDLIISAEKPPKLKSPIDLFKYTEGQMEQFKELWDKGFEGLKEGERDRLISFFLMSMIENEDEEFYRKLFEKYSYPWLEELDLDELIRMMEAIDYSYLSLAIGRAYQLNQVLLNQRFSPNKVITYQSRYGLMVYGSTGDDHYPSALKAKKDTPICLLIEPSGNDTYELELLADKHSPIVFFHDFEGEDLYRTNYPSFSALGGIFIGCDHAGDDLYSLYDFSFAAVLGLSLFTDKSGDDIYQSGIFSQGAAFCGIALMLDEEGNDSYNAHCLAQGFAGTLGAGLLADYSGADVYYLGGRYLHAPLMPQDYRTMGQGMGFGMRPNLAGGLGFLYDGGGSDKYLGGVYAQGVGYWYAAGVLIDEGGNDVYNAVYYPQGSGIHLACGVLYDHQGNDAYYSRNGPGQGAGHDWAFGMLIDAEGDDAYSIHGGNGLGLSNSLGVFIDRSGNDRYERNESQSYGSANYSRDTGGIGIFLDGGGDDQYPGEGKANNTDWGKGTYGFGRDGELFVKEELKEDEPIYEQDAPPAADAPIEEVFKAAAEWEVGSAIMRVREARKILNDRAEEASEYILKNKLANTSGLEYRALEAFSNANESFRERLFYYVADSDSLVAKTAMSLLAAQRDIRLLPYVKEHLLAGRYQSACISILGLLDDEKSLSLLLAQDNLPTERLNFLRVRAIAMHESEAAKEALMEFTGDPSFLIQVLLRKTLEKTDE